MKVSGHTLALIQTSYFLHFWLYYYFVAFAEFEQPCQCTIKLFFLNIIFAVLLDVLITKLSFWSGGETYERILHISDEGWTNICRWHYIRQRRLPCQCYSSSHKVDAVLAASQFHRKPCHVSIFCCLWIVFHCAVFLTFWASCNAAEVFMMMPWWWQSDRYSLVLKTVSWMYLPC